MNIVLNKSEQKILQNFDQSHQIFTKTKFDVKSENDEEKLISHLSTVSKGKTEYINNLAKYFLEKNNLQRAYNLFSITLEKNNNYAKYYIGVFYLKGLKQGDTVIVPKKEENGIRLIKQAAEGKNAVGAAQCRLGTIYQKKGNFKAALYWFEKAIEHNNPFALCVIGDYYEYGRADLKIDYQKAYDYYSRANNYSWATYRIALMHKEGHGTPKNLHKAKELLEEAIQEGSRMAKYEIGTWYEFGISHNDFCLDINIERALEYYYDSVKDVELSEKYRMDEESNFACYRIAIIKEKQGDSDAINWFKRAAEFDNFDACNWLSENNFAY